MPSLTVNGLSIIRIVCPQLLMRTNGTVFLNFNKVQIWFKNLIGKQKSKLSRKLPVDRWRWGEREFKKLDWLKRRYNKYLFRRGRIILKEKNRKKIAIFHLIFADTSFPIFTTILVLKACCKPNLSLVWNQLLIVVYLRCVRI